MRNRSVFLKYVLDSTTPHPFVLRLLHLNSILFTSSWLFGWLYSIALLKWVNALWSIERNQIHSLFIRLVENVLRTQFNRFPKRPIHLRHSENKRYFKNNNFFSPSFIYLIAKYMFINTNVPTGNCKTNLFVVLFLLQFHFGR